MSLPFPVMAGQASAAVVGQPKREMDPMAPRIFMVLKARNRDTNHAKYVCVYTGRLSCIYIYIYTHMYIIYIYIYTSIYDTHVLHIWVVSK